MTVAFGLKELRAHLSVYAGEFPPDMSQLLPVPACHCPCEVALHTSMRCMHQTICRSKAVCIAVLPVLEPIFPVVKCSVWILRGGSTEEDVYTPRVHNFPHSNFKHTICAYMAGFCARKGGDIQAKTRSCSSGYLRDTAGVTFRRCSRENWHAAGYSKRLGYLPMIFLHDVLADEAACEACGA